jgi:signal transduction histidine kinase
MNAIIGFTRMVLRRGSEQLSERHKENLNKVTQSADHLLNLINSILDLSKIEAGRMDVEVSSFEVKGLIEACCANVTPLVKTGVLLRQEIPEDIGQAETDEGRLRQIVINLISNALKFTDSGQVTIEVSKSGTPDANAMLAIMVADTGSGIPEDALNDIFEEFQQVKGSDPHRKGTGLGLPITKGFAELLGGSIHVQSEVGKGSRFTVRVPVVFAAGS